MAAVSGPQQMVLRLRDAVNAHDLEALVACFSAEYRNDTPLHPARGFTGREQVRRNWDQIFKFVPDISADVLRCTADGDTVWSEWEHRGTRPDGSPHLMRGVVIFGVSGDKASSARFYLEPVHDDGTDADAAIARLASSGGTP